MFRAAAPVLATAADIRRMYDDLGIKELIDLRSSDELRMLPQEVGARGAAGACKPWLAMRQPQLAGALCIIQALPGFPGSRSTAPSFAPALALPAPFTHAHTPLHFTQNFAVFDNISFCKYFRDYVTMRVGDWRRLDGGGRQVAAAAAAQSSAAAAAGTLVVDLAAAKGQRLRARGVCGGLAPSRLGVDPCNGRPLFLFTRSLFPTRCPLP